MKNVLLLPFICQLDGVDVTVQLQSESLTAECHRQGDRGKETFHLMDGCTDFCAAVGQKEMIHIIATDSEKQLHYFLFSREGYREFPFIIHEVPSVYSLVFSENGQGVFLSQGQSGTLKGACFTDRTGWMHSEYTFGVAPIPITMAMDQSGRTHLLATDEPGSALWYLALPSKPGRIQASIQLDVSLSAQICPALSFDQDKNIHLAWLSAKDNELCYRFYVAGGWPVGGWQPEQVIEIEKEPKFISFITQNSNLQLWVQSRDGGIKAYEVGSGNTGMVRDFPEFLSPVRVGLPGRTELSLAVRDQDGSYSLVTSSIQTKQSDTIDESPLLEHAYKVMAEKKQLEVELTKKVEALKQFQQELERTSELEQMFVEQKNTISQLQQTLGQKNDYLEVKRKEVQSLKERVGQLEKKADRLTESCHNQYQTINQLQNELAVAKDNERNRMKEVRELELQLEEKKSKWLSFKKILTERGEKK